MINYSRESIENKLPKGACEHKCQKNCSIGHAKSNIGIPNRTPTHWEEFIVAGVGQNLQVSKSKVIGSIVKTFKELNLPMACPFLAIELLNVDHIEEMIMEMSDSKPVARQLLSMTLLVLCYKLNETCQIKHTISQLRERWSQASVTTQEIVEKEEQILRRCNFDIIVQTSYLLIGEIFSGASCKSSKTIYLTEYLLELSMTANFKQLFYCYQSQITEVLSAIKLACHLQCDITWNDGVLAQFSIQEGSLHQSCQRLFFLMTKASEVMPEVFRKYNCPRYNRVSDIKLIRIHRATIRSTQIFRCSEDSVTYLTNSPSAAPVIGW